MENRSSELMTVYQENYDSLLGVLTARLSDFHRATEVVHETYLRLVRLREGQLGHINNPKAYVFKIAQNIAIDLLRRESGIGRRHSDDGLTESLADDAPSPETVSYDRERIRILDKMLAKMPEKQRRALLMARVDRLSHAEIAQTLGVSRSMVAKYLARGLRQCRDTLEDLE